MSLNRRLFRMRRVASAFLPLFIFRFRPSAARGNPQNPVTAPIVHHAQRAQGQGVERVFSKVLFGAAGLRQQEKTSGKRKIFAGPPASPSETVEPAFRPGKKFSRPLDASPARDRLERRNGLGVPCAGADGVKRKPAFQGCSHASRAEPPFPSRPCRALVPRRARISGCPCQNPHLKSLGTPA